LPTTSYQYDGQKSVIPQKSVTIFTTNDDDEDSKQCNDSILRFYSPNNGNLVRQEWTLDNSTTSTKLHRLYDSKCDKWEFLVIESMDVAIIINQTGTVVFKDAENWR